MRNLIWFLTLFFLFLHGNLFSQTNLFKGIVKDERTLKPVHDVNIKVHGTNNGTSTDKFGFFSLRITKVPASLVITCVGYENAYYDVLEVPQTPVEFSLTPKSYPLREVDISAVKYSYLFKDKNYSVLDYELMDGNILLLVFRYQLKRSELVLLNLIGDTLAISKLPEIPPVSLFKDFLANVHYFSRAGNAYQVFFNRKENRIEFLHKTTVDSLSRLVEPFIFKMSDRLYFQEDLANGFGTAIGFYEQGAGKKYIRKHFDEKKIAEYIDDQTYYQKWNATVPPQHYFMTDREDEFYTTPAFDFSRGESPGQFYEVNEERAHEFEFYRLVFPVIKTGENTIAFFNFPGNYLELMNENGKVINTVPVTFHQETASKALPASSNQLLNIGWRWGPQNPG